jgi:hypothetical protein
MIAPYSFGYVKINSINTSIHKTNVYLEYKTSTSSAKVINIDKTNITKTLKYICLVMQSQKCGEFSTDMFLLYTNK